MFLAAAAVELPLVLRRFDPEKLDVVPPFEDVHGQSRPALADGVADQVLAIGQVHYPVAVVSLGAVRVVLALVEFMVVLDELQRRDQRLGVVGDAVALGVERRLGHVQDASAPAGVIEGFGRIDLVDRRTAVTWGGFGCPRFSSLQIRRLSATRPLPAGPRFRC
jgi:hypothetical protein